MRLFGTVAYQVSNSPELRQVAARCYFHAVPHQTNESGSALDFVLKSVPAICHSCGDAGLLEESHALTAARALTGLLVRVDKSTRATKAVVRALRSLYLSAGATNAAIAQEVCGHLLTLLRKPDADDKLRIAVRRMWLRGVATACRRD